MPDNHRSHHRRGVAMALLIALLAAVLVACGDESNAMPSPTAADTEGASSTPTTPAATAATTPTAPPISDADVREQLPERVLAILDPAGEAPEEALAEIEVVVLPLPGLDRDLWLAVSSGFGIFELGEGATHVLAIYERGNDSTLAEVAVHPLALEPTNTAPEVLSDVPGSEGGAWIAVHGFTGVHSGTFELLWFDGATLMSELTGFSSSPGAAYLEDLDGDGIAEVVLDASDHYVYCYACGVVAWSEILYRWVDGRPVEVPIAAVASDNQAAHDLTEQAAILAEAGLWRRALEAAEQAVEAAPDDEDVAWLLRVLALSAQPRLDAAGAEPQPLITNVIAGEYESAAALIAAHTPEEAFAPDGPLFAGTAAEGWEPQTAEYLVTYSTAALEVDADLASAYLVRALGYALTESPDWSAALADIEAALALDPANGFLDAAAAYLRTLA